MKQIFGKVTDQIYEKFSDILLRNGNTPSM